VDYAYTEIFKCQTGHVAHGALIVDDENLESRSGRHLLLLAYADSLFMPSTRHLIDRVLQRLHRRACGCPECRDPRRDGA
jgi:hypothetical protein